MGIGLRVFLVDNNDAFIKVSYARWERLHSNHPTERFPEYAGKRMRFIMVFLDLEERKPVYINHLDLGYIIFDADGKMDQEDWERHKHLVVESADLFGPEENEGNVINAQTEFLRRTYRHRYRWEFPDGMLERLIKTIFS